MTHFLQCQNKRSLELKCERVNTFRGAAPTALTCTGTKRDPSIENPPETLDVPQRPSYFLRHRRNTGETSGVPASNPDAQASGDLTTFIDGGPHTVDRALHVTDAG
jgi:hypothetical protein